jgi:hypothetical protein
MVSAHIAQPPGHMPNAGRSLVQLQVAVGVLGGCQIVGHASQAGMSADRSCVSVQVD